MYILGDDKRQQAIGGAKVLCKGEIPVSFHLNPLLLKKGKNCSFPNIFVLTYYLYHIFFSPPHNMHKYPCCMLESCILACLGSKCVNLFSRESG